jgi:hypothetical protein
MREEGTAMKSTATILIAAMTALMLGPAVFAASSSSTPPATKAAAARASAPPYEIEGKILRVGKGWIQVQVTKVDKGPGLKAGSRLRVVENARTQIMQGGKAAAGAQLTAGETVRISGQIVRSGRATSYRAATVDILR